MATAGMVHSARLTISTTKWHEAMLMFATCGPTSVSTVVNGNDSIGRTANAACSARGCRREQDGQNKKVLNSRAKNASRGQDGHDIWRNRQHGSVVVEITAPFQRVLSDPF